MKIDCAEAHLWRYRQRDMVGMAACLLMACMGAYVVFR